MSDKKITFFDFLNAINTKNNTDIDINAYNPFMVNRGLSYFKDTVLWANEMNCRSGLSHDMQYKFFMEVVKKGKRFSKWHKADKDENLDLISEAYNCSRQKALEISLLLNKEQIDAIKERLFKGGRKNGI